MLDFVNKVGFDYSSIDEAFPPCDPGVEPMGSRVLVQFRTPKRKTSGGIYLTNDVRDTEAYNTQIAKVIAVGPVAFHNRSTLEPWPEGQWAEIGDFVRVPKYGGDRFTGKTESGEDALFVIFNDLDIIAKVKDPLTMKAFL